MNKKVFSVIAILVALALLLSACRLPASTAPQATATSQSELPFPVATNSDLVNQFLSITQTAVAQSMQATPQPGGQTGGGVETPSADQAGGGITTGGTEATDQAGGGMPEAQPTDQTGGGVTTDQTGGGAPEAQQSGGGVTQATPAPNYQLPAAPARPATYTIQRGEYPYCIARRYNVDPGALMRANNLSTSSQLPIGSTITIPATGNWEVSSFGSRALRAHPTTYTVTSGETMNSIACKFGDVYPEFIAAANGLAANAALTPGATINIP